MRNASGSLTTPNCLTFDSNQADFGSSDFAVDPLRSFLSDMLPLQ